MLSTMRSQFSNRSVSTPSPSGPPSRSVLAIRPSDLSRDAFLLSVTTKKLYARLGRASLR